jgi:hypothetical protein
VTGVSYNVASLPTQVNLGSGDSDIFAYDSNTLRMTQFKFNVGTQSQSLTGSLTWNANSTLGQLASTDQFNSADTQTCTYSHDDLVRIASANCGSRSMVANLTTFCFVGFGTDRLRRQDAMKTAGRENPNRGVTWPRNRAPGAVGQNKSRSIKWAAKQEKVQPKVLCFFLTSPFIELTRS